MKKNILIYLIYLTIIIIVTTWLSIFIIEHNNKPSYELMAPGFSKDTGECPCENVGVESSYCGNFFMQESENSILYNELRPNSDQIFDGSGVCISPTIIKINSNGFRDYEYSLDKSDNTFRIIVLGDSYTFGHGVELNETYSKLLENELNKRVDGLKYEVLNFGVPGYSAVEKVEILKYNAMKFNPDLIIFQYLDDDVLDWTEFRQIEKEKMLEYIRASENKITKIQERMFYEKVYSEYLNGLNEKEFDKVWEIVKKSFEKLSVVAPNKPVLLLAYSGGKPQLSKLNKICQKNNWTMMRVEEYYSLIDEKFIIHPKDPHPNAFSHRLIAEEIYEKLIENNLLQI